MKDKQLPDVRVGQVWADNDHRSPGRILRVERIHEGKATCSVTHKGTSLPQKNVRVSINRFRPVSNGYRLIQETSEVDEQV